MTLTKIINGILAGAVFHASFAIADIKPSSPDLESRTFRPLLEEMLPPAGSGEQQSELPWKYEFREILKQYPDNEILEAYGWRDDPFGTGKSGFYKITIDNIDKVPIPTVLKVISQGVFDKKTGEIALHTSSEKYFRFCGNKLLSREPFLIYSFVFDTLYIPPNKDRKEWEEVKNPSEFPTKKFIYYVPDCPK